MTTEERLAAVEHSIQHHDVSVNLLIGIAERQQTLLEEIREDVKETKRHANTTQRLWVHLARKNGWLEDEDWPPPER